MIRLTKRIFNRLFQRGASPGRPGRLVIHKAKWRHNAASPVVLMIDDLTNAWVGGHDAPASPREDWGGRYFAAGSAVSFLNANLLQLFPKAAVTYFTVAGSMNSFNTESAFTFAAALDHDHASVDFFRSIEFSARGEIAYHGLHHGVPRQNSKDYIQEWQSFSSLDEAASFIDEGKQIFYRVFGHMPYGGKYGGYKSNELSEISIEEGGFIYWCRDWTPRDTTGSIHDDFYELEYFGARRRVVSIPSTVHGKHWTNRQLDLLLERRQIISIQEHIAPQRPDGRVQTPNIYNDIRELAKCYAYLESKPVWHATCREIAEYFIGYAESLFFDLQRETFRVEYRGALAEPIITVIVSAQCLCSADKPFIDVFLPDGRQLSGRHIIALDKQFQFQVDLPLLSGQYTVKAAASAAPWLEAVMGGEGRINFTIPRTAGEVEVDLPGDAVFHCLLEGTGTRKHHTVVDGKLRFYCSDSSVRHTCIAHGSDLFS